jgi:hypothetical protein
MPGDECVLECVLGRDFELQRSQAAGLWPHGAVFWAGVLRVIARMLTSERSSCKGGVVDFVEFPRWWSAQFMQIVPQSRFSLPRDYRGKGCLRRRFSSGIAAY